MFEAILVVVWKHRLVDGQRVWPPELQDYVGVLMLPEAAIAAFDERLRAALTTRFGRGEFTCMPDPPSLRKPEGYWGGGGRSILVA